MTTDMEHYKLLALQQARPLHHYLKIVSQNAQGCISVHIHFKKFLGEGGGGGEGHAPVCP